jgi:hypothetical protein
MQILLKVSSIKLPSYTPHLHGWRHKSWLRNTEVWSPCGKWVGQGGDWASFSDIFDVLQFCTLHFSLQMAEVQSTNHRPVLISAPNMFLMVLGVGV